MTTIRIGWHSDTWGRVVNAFEAETGLPLGVGADLDWLMKVLARFNEQNNTNIGYSHEDYGYWFQCSTPEEALMLDRIREKYELVP